MAVLFGLMLMMLLNFPLAQSMVVSMKPMFSHLPPSRNDILFAWLVLVVPWLAVLVQAA